jgi:hypothetical protein
MNPKLSILMPTLVERQKQRWKLTQEFRSQFSRLGITASNPTVETLYLEDNGEMSLGEKLNQLTAMAGGEYVAVVDDDDRVAGCYVEELLKAIDTDIALEKAKRAQVKYYPPPIKPDVITFDLYRVDLAEVWTFGTVWEDRTDLTTSYLGQSWDVQPRGKVLGMVSNHLCAWQRELAIQVPWQDQTRGVDVLWYTAMREKFPDAREVHIPKILYLYFYDADKTVAQKKPS